MSDAVRLNNPASVARIAKQLKNVYGAVLVDFAAQMTAMRVLIVPKGCAVFMDSEGVREPFTQSMTIFVTCVGMSRSAEIPWGTVHSGYLQEKLDGLLPGDARNVAALLNAIMHREGAEDYLTRVVRIDGDRVADDQFM